MNLIDRLRGTLAENIAQSGKSPFFKWSVSFTRQFTNSGLEFLREDHPEEIVRSLMEWATDPQEMASVGNLVIEELLAHANYQKAALVTRELVKQHPEYRDLIAKRFEGHNYALFTANPLLLPAKPDEVKRKSGSTYSLSE